MLNATCPLVTKVHNQGKRYVAQGRRLILIGHAGHPEVEGTTGQISEPVTLVQTEADVGKLDIPSDTPVAYVTQTTLSVDDTRGIIAALHRRFTDIVGPETRDICYATQNRQTAVRELSQAGGRYSGGRRQEQFQFEPAARDRRRGRHARYLIADGSEVEPEWFNGAETVGITAGASAPEALVEDVIDALRRLGPVEVSELTGRRRQSNFVCRPN